MESMLIKMIKGVWRDKGTFAGESDFLRDILWREIQRLRDEEATEKK